MSDFDEGDFEVVGVEQDLMSPELKQLREAVMLASSPKPGFRLTGIVMVSVWYDGDASWDSDILTWPSGRGLEMLRVAEHLCGTLRREHGES